MEEQWHQAGLETFKRITIHQSVFYSNNTCIILQITENIQKEFTALRNSN